MEDVKADGAAIWIIDRDRPKVIKVDQIGRDHHSGKAEPLRAHKGPSKEEREEEMPAVVEEELELLYAPIQSAKKLSCAARI